MDGLKGISAYQISLENMSNSSWTDINQLPERIKHVRHQWLRCQFERTSPIELVPSILRLLEASDAMPDSKTTSRDLPKLLSLVFMNYIANNQSYPLEFLDMMGTRLERFHQSYQSIFKEFMTFIPKGEFDRVGWYRRICRIFDEKTLKSDAEAIALSEQTTAYASKFSQGVNLYKMNVEVSFDTPQEFIQSDTIGLARSIGKRAEQLDGVIYSDDIWAVIDAHRNSECLIHFQTHFEQRLRAALASRSEAGVASVYNVVVRIILDFNDELFEVISKADGLVFVLGVRDGQYLHLFSLGDCSAVLCHPDKQPERLFPPQQINKNNLDKKNQLIDKRLFNQALQRGGALVTLGNNLRLYHDNNALEMVATLGDKDVPGVVHRPLYRMLLLEELRGHVLLGYSDGVGNHLSMSEVKQLVDTHNTCPSIANACVKHAVQKACALQKMKPRSQVDNAICMAHKF